METTAIASSGMLFIKSGAFFEQEIRSAAESMEIMIGQSFHLNMLE